MSLKTPEKLRRLQEALYAKAKREPSCRFYLLYDKLWRDDVLAHAFALCRSNGGAAGVDGQTFDDIEAYGQARWLDELQEEVRTNSYRPAPLTLDNRPSSGGAQPTPAIANADAGGGMMGIPPLLPQEIIVTVGSRYVTE